MKKKEKKTDVDTAPAPLLFNEQACNKTLASFDLIMGFFEPEISRTGIFAYQIAN